MKIVTAIDSFKGSMTSIEAGNAFAQGVHRVDPDAQVIVRPVADGGEGTVEAVVSGMNGYYVHVNVTGPVGKPVDCVYGIVRETMTAVIEISGAAGITLVSSAEKNPLHTTTYGVGEVIRDALMKGCRRFIIGLGGSATNDGGVGMLQALGYGLLDKDGRQICLGGEGLKDLVEIDDENVLPELKECTFRLACDVTNPLCGSNGASAVYGPQKGADEAMIHDMDRWLAAYAEIAGRKYPDRSCADEPGAGAAGGLGFAFMTFMNAVPEAGVRIVLEETKLKDYIRDADLVITGEGKLDFQTAMGKTPIGVASLAKKFNKPVIAFAGSVTEDAGECNAHGIDAFFPVLRDICTLEEAMDKKTAEKNMMLAAEQAYRLFMIGRRYR